MANNPNAADNLIPRKKGDPPLPGAGRPKGRKSLSTMVRDVLENEIDWKQVPLKNTDEFRAMYGDKPLAGEVLVRGALAEAMGKGGTAAREWLRKSGYGDKLQLGGDEDNPRPILGNINVHSNDSTQKDSGDAKPDQGSPGGDERREDDSDSPAADSDSPDQEKVD